MDPNKDVVLDVSSTSSDSEVDFVSPLTQLASTSAATAGTKHVIVALSRVRPRLAIAFFVYALLQKKCSQSVFLSIISGAYNHETT